MPRPRGTRQATTFRKEAKQLPKKKTQAITNSRITQVCDAASEPIDSANQAGIRPARKSVLESAGNTNSVRNTSNASSNTSARIIENRT